MAFDQTFWTGLSFVVFVALVIKPAGRFVINALDERTKKIENELGEALRLKEEAQALLASYQKKQKEVTEEAAMILEEAQAESKRIAKQAEKDLEESLNKRIETAMQKIASYENAILDQVKNNAVDIAVSTVRSLLIEHMNNEMADDLISHAVTEVDSKLH